MFGITHIPRLEDWPVMPVERIGFALVVIFAYLCISLVSTSVLLSWYVCSLNDSIIIVIYIVIGNPC